MSKVSHMKYYIAHNSSANYANNKYAISSSYMSEQPFKSVEVLDIPKLSSDWIHLFQYQFMENHPQ